jgi:hypothetical protein
METPVVSAQLQFWSSLGVMSLSTYWAIVQIKQGLKIHKEEKVDSISVVWMMFFFFLCPLYLSHGVMNDLWAMVYHGSVRGLTYIPILWGIWKFRGYRKFEFALGGLLIVALIMHWFVPWEKPYFFIFALAGPFATSLQPLAIYRQKTLGVFEPHVILAMLCANLFWHLFSIYFQDWPLFVLCLFYYIPIVWLIQLWFKYRKAR